MNRLSLPVLMMLVLWTVIACSSSEAVDSVKSPAPGDRQPITHIEKQATEIEETPAGDSKATPPPEQNRLPGEQTAEAEEPQAGDGDPTANISEKPVVDVQEETPPVTEPAAETENAATAGGALTLSDIPLYPGATPYERGQHPLFEEIIGSMGGLQLPEGYEAESYTVPSGTTVKEIENFYNGALAKLGWQMEWGGGDTPTSGVDDKVLSSLGWGSQGRSFIITFWEFPQSTLAPMPVHQI